MSKLIEELRNHPLFRGVIEGADDDPAPQPAAKEWTAEQLKEFVGGIVKEAVEPLKTQTNTLAGLFQAASGPRDHKDDAPEKGIRMARTLKSWIVSRADMVPVAFAAEKLYPQDKALAKALGESTGSTGGFIVPPQYASEVIEFLRDLAVFRRLGARAVPMNSNVLNLPRQSAGSTATYVGENANITKTEPALDMINMSAKKLAALVPVSSELIRDASVSADAWVRDDLVQALAVREDAAFIRDDGTAAKPKGVRYWVASGNITTANSTVNIANTLADLKTSIRKFKQGRKGRLIRPVWLMSTRTEQYLAHLVTGAPERYFFREEMLTGKFFGWPFGVTDQIPDNIGGGSNGSELYLIDMFEAIIGENQNVEIAASTEAAYDDGGTVRAAFSLDQTVVRIISRHDFALRHDLGAHILDDVRWV